jgi:thymidylate synthase (FAD)
MTKSPEQHDEQSIHTKPNSAQEELILRPHVAALDEILGRRFPVLDDGFIRLIDYMGDDAAIVQAARVSYGAGTKKVQEDRALIRYLLRHSHTTPFEMCEIKLHIRAPMDVWRQWIRHRTASVNEYSTRYSVAIDAAQRTSPQEWRVQSQTNKQGSGGALSLDKGQRLSVEEEHLQKAMREAYEGRLAAGVAREQARKDLPLSTYTEAYWKIDLHNLFHFLQLRMDTHAQQEIRSYAEVIGNQIVAQWVPVAWGAFLDYRRDAFPLSRIEFEVIRAVIEGSPKKALAAASDNGLLKCTANGDLRRNREREELEIKLRTLGLAIPWTESPHKATSSGNG